MAGRELQEGYFRITINGFKGAVRFILDAAGDVTFEEIVAHIATKVGTQPERVMLKRDGVPLQPLGNAQIAQICINRRETWLGCLISIPNEETTVIDLCD